MGAFSSGSLSRVCSGALRDLRITFLNSVKNISRQYMNRIMGKNRERLVSALYHFSGHPYCTRMIDHIISEAFCLCDCRK